MSIMVAQDLARTIQTYWRIRAGIAFLRANEGKIESETFSYANTGISSAYSMPVSEKSSDALGEIYAYIHDGWLSRDYFLRLINHLEAFYIRKLRVRTLATGGTFGALQKRCEQAYGVTAPISNAIDEIRERRNAFMHHEGVPHIKYQDAAQLVYATSGGAVKDPASVSLLDVSNEYLNYCVDQIANYVRNF